MGETSLAPPHGEAQAAPAALLPPEGIQGPSTLGGPSEGKWRGEMVSLSVYAPTPRALSRFFLKFSATLSLKYLTFAFRSGTILDRGSVSTSP